MKDFKDFKACLRNVLSFSKQINSKIHFTVTFSGGIHKGGTYITLNAYTSDLDLIPKLLRYFYNLPKRMPWVSWQDVEISMSLDYPTPRPNVELYFWVNSPFPEINYRWKMNEADRHYQYAKVQTGSPVYLERLCLG